MIRTFIVRFNSGRIASYDGLSASAVRRSIEQWTDEPFTFSVFATRHWEVMYG